ncbi:hypothetical protein SLS55_006140 [Diplodia seriata]|uniref:Uncharacterized protein n=1 Tax=Diplodia seriata TaxID=420778 RepID=A0ABR3CDC9_9PEZI
MATPEGDAPGDPEAGLGRDYTQSNADGTSQSLSVGESKTEPIPKDHWSKIPDDAADKARNRKTYASFGDDGTTASVNAYGHIIQISRFLNHGRSGLFCVDLPETPEPYLVKPRMERLVEISDDPRTGLRLEFESEHEDLSKLRTACPSLEFIHDRWPLYTLTTSIGNTKESARVDGLSVQYFCNNGTVFQKYTWKPGGEPLPSLPRVRFSSDVLIRDLDFVDPENHFNDQDWGYFRPRGSGDSPLILLHQLPSDSGHGESQGPNGGHAQPVAGLIMAPFAYRKLQKIENKEGRMHEIEFTQEAKEKFLQDGTLEITMAYKLELKSSGESWDDAEIDEEELETNTSYQKIKFSADRHLDFIIRRNLEHILSVCSVPVSPGGLAIALTCGDFSGHRVSSPASLYVVLILFCDT